MHYSQIKKQSSHRKGAHPGTPRPNPENFTPVEGSHHYSPSGRGAASILEEERQGRQELNLRSHHGQSHKSQQRSCDFLKLKLPRQERVAATTTISPSNSSESLPDYLVWVKNEPFEFGVVSPLPCPKIGINILRKIAEYCREKPGHFPELSLNQWSHICKYKMQLATDLCFTYFHVFEILTRSSSTWTQHIHNHSEETGDSSASVAGESWDIKFHKVVKQGHDFNEEFKVDTMQFLLFLYIQHFLRLHKKYFMKSCGDEPWPKTWATNLTHRSGGVAGTGTIAPEQQQAEFIMANLPDIIDFLMLLHETGKPTREAKDKSESRSSKEKAESTDQEDSIQYQRITMHVMKALSLILGVASTTPNNEFKTLDECLQFPDIRWKLEYSRYSRTVDKKCFIQWVMKNLKINPWGPSSIPIPQATLSPMTGVFDQVENFKQNKIFWNTQSYPKSWVLISGVERQVLVMDTLEPMTSIKIHRCANAFIYLPGVYSYILIHKCYGITLNIGVTSKVIKIHDCSGITVCGVGRQFIISDVSLSSFHVLTPSSPIVCGSKNHKIYLAPYNTTYPNLTSHMKTAGISVKIQRWNRPLEIANDCFPRAFQQSNVIPLSMEHFKMLYFPFKMGGSCTNLINPLNNLPLPGTLPSSYQRRVDYASEKADLARSEFAAKLMHSEEDTSLIFQITLQRFKKWLKESGYYELIVGLRSYQKSLEQEVSLPVSCSKGHDLTCIPKALKNFFKGDGDVENASSIRSNPSISSSSQRSRHNLKHQQHEKNSSTVNIKKQHEGNREVVCEPRHRDVKTFRGAGDEGSKGYDGLKLAKGQSLESVKTSSNASLASVKRD